MSSAVGFQGSFGSIFPHSAVFLLPIKQLQIKQRESMKQFGGAQEAASLKLMRVAQTSQPNQKPVDNRPHESNKNSASERNSPPSQQVLWQEQGTTPQNQQNQHLKVVHETFSIDQLERKMMFLNEPSLQMAPNQAQDQIRQLWRLHYLQMQNMEKCSLAESDSQNLIENAVAKRPDSIDEIGGQCGFSTPGQRPKDFDRFQTVVRSQLEELDREHQGLRKRFRQAGVEVDEDIKRIEQLTESLQKVFNDFIACFNQFAQREERLETLHTQAIRKSKELSKKMQLEVMAQSSQRSQLLAIVDDLTAQLKEIKATTVATTSLKNEHAAHEGTRQFLEEVQKENRGMKQEIEKLKVSFQQLGQSGESLKADKMHLQAEISSLNDLIQEQQVQIEDSLVRRQQLEIEVSRLKSQVELTQSSKDKIILKLKQELRMQVHQSGMNTTMNNTIGLNTSQTALAASKQQINQLQSQMQLRQSQFNTGGHTRPQQPQ